MPNKTKMPVSPETTLKITDEPNTAAFLKVLRKSLNRSAVLSGVPPT